MHVARILAIDYGKKRCGIAETDDLQIIASPLDTVPESELIAFLEAYLLKYDVEIIVVGEPRRMDGSDTHATQPANDLAKKLQKAFPGVCIDRQDETFTSKMAVQSMIDAGAKKSDRRKKENIDKVSAAIILQSYMERKS